MRGARHLIRRGAKSPGKPNGLPGLNLSKKQSCVLLLSVPADGAVGCLILRNAIPDQNQNLTVCRAPLVIRHHMELIQHFLINSNGKTFYSHIITPKQIYFVFILGKLCGMMQNIDIKYI